MTFVAQAGKKVMPGVEVVATLHRQVLLDSSDLLDLPLLSVDTVVCQNNCSGTHLSLYLCIPHVVFNVWRLLLSASPVLSRLIALHFTLQTWSAILTISSNTQSSSSRVSSSAHFLQKEFHPPSSFS